MRWIKRIIGVLVVIIVALVIAVVLLPGEKIARFATDQIRAQTGREVTLADGVRFSFYPILGVSTGAVTVANADWSDLGPMLKAESLKIGVDFMALFGGEVKVTDLEIVRPEILLERNADGSGNWELTTEQSAGSGESGTTALTLDRAVISSGSLRYVDHAIGTEQSISNIDLVLQLPDYQGPADIDLTMSPAGSPVRIVAQIAQFGKFIGGAMVPLSAQIDVAGSKVSFDGSGAMAPEAQGTLNIDLPDTSAFLQALGLGAVDLPQGLGRAVTLDATAVLASGQQFGLQDMRLALDQNQLSGSVDVLLDDTPRIEAALSAGALDFSALGAGEGESGGGEGWSPSAIDASGLAAVDAVISLVAASVDTGTLKLGKTDLLLTLDQSRLVIDLREIEGYSGGFSGEIVVNNRSGLSVGGNIVARGVEVKGLLSDMAGITRLTGKADADIRFQGAGQSVSAIMNSLGGGGSVNIGRGTISGFDLDKLMRSGDATGGTTIFDSMGATFTIASGNLQNDDLLMRLPVLQATGKGRVGLGARDIDYLFTPSTVTSSGESGISIPVRIKGPWSSPKIIPDLEAAIGVNIEEQTDPIKDGINKSLQEKLGVTPGNGQSGGTTSPQNLGDAATKGLRNLLRKK